MEQSEAITTGMNAKTVMRKEGFEPGMKVVIVEDVVTTGGSALQAVERIQDFGCEVVCVAGIIDRLEGGKANFEARGLEHRTLLTIRDFGLEPPTE